MKSVIENNNVQRMGVQSEGTFRIKATGKAFRILSDGLYSDKITAIIRELSCNAYDAHVEAGTLDTPFTIHLPTQFEPHFSLRDFGIGLSHKDVIQVYTTYFESTKTDSNDYIGCLGLGSKSPFSYVDNFTIVSFFNGEKRTYNAFMNEDNIPSIALMNEEKTDDTNGVEVSFAVCSNDFRSFYSRMPNVFRYFKVQPEITGHKDIEIKPIQYGLKGNGWGIRKDDSHYGARAIMGNVAYPLTDMDEDKVTSDEYDLINSSIDIKFGIGELEVAASRENISFNKITINNVKIRLARLVKEVSKQVSDELNACPTLWDARVRAVELSNGTYSGLKSIFKVGDILFKGQEIEGGLSSSIVNIEKELRDEIGIEAFAPRSRRRRKNRYSSYNSDEKIVSLSRDVNGIAVKSKGFKFFTKDIDRGSHIRCKQVINASKDTDEQIDIVYLLDEGDTDAISRLMDVLGYEGDIDPISSIERPKRVSNGSGENNPMNSKKMLVYQTDTDEHNRHEKSSYWTTEKVDVKLGGLYVPISRYKIFGDYDPSEYIEPLISTLASVGIDTEDLKVVGVKTAMQDKIINDDNWTNLKEYAKAKVEKHIEDNDIRKHLVIAKAYTNSLQSGSRFDNFVKTHKDEWKLVNDSPISKYSELLDEWKESKNLITESERLMARVNLSWYDEAAQADTEKLDKERIALFEEVSATYPMLKLVADSYTYDGETVKNYIDLIDGMNKNKKS